VISSKSISLDPFTPLLFEARTHLLAAFEQVGEKFGHSKSEARQLFGLLPRALRAAPVAWSKIGKNWCYAFGKPYTGFTSNTVVVGTPQLPPVERLYQTVIAVCRYFSARDQIKIFEKLGQEEKHTHYLEEIAPIMRLQGPATVRYEVAGDGGRTIDFQIDADGQRPVLLEVKYRCKDIIHFLTEFTRNESLGKAEEDISPPEPAWLFPSVVEKFKPVPFEIQAQGVWIYTGVAQVELKLRNYFEGLDPTRLHFAVLSGGDDRAYILARSPEIEAFVVSFFRLVHHRASVR